MTATARRVQTFRAGPMKAIYIEKARLLAGRPAIVVKQGERPPYRFRQVLILGPSIVRQEGEEAWLWTEEEVEGQREEKS